MNGGPPQASSPRGGRAAAVLAVGLSLSLALVAVGMRVGGGNSGLEDPVVGQRPAPAHLHLIDLRPTEARQQVPVPQARTLVHFWSPHCGPCKEMAPDIAALASESASRPGHRVVGVTADAVMDVREYLAQNTLAYPTLWDPRGRFHGALGVSTLPADVLFSKDGQVLRVWRRPPTRSQLRDALFSP